MWPYMGPHINVFFSVLGPLWTERERARVVRWSTPRTALPDDCCAEPTAHINLLWVPSSGSLPWLPTMQIPARSGSGQHVLSWVSVTVSRGFYGYFTDVCFPHWTSNSSSYIYQQGSSFDRTPNLWVGSVGCQEAAYTLMDLLPRRLRMRLEPAQQSKWSGALCSY